MSGAALSISWAALAFGVIGYVLKRWWDNADSIMEYRRKAYSDYFAACYDMARELMHRADEPTSKAVDAAYELFQSRTPDFLLHASPTVITISDEFYDRFRKFQLANRSTWSEEEKAELLSNLSQALGVLREVIKSELFLTQPRFQIERLIYRRRWAKMLDEQK